MVTDNHYRWDFIGLSTDNKPTPATSEKVVDGSTFYCSDNSKLYVYCNDRWYEKEATGGGTTYTAGSNITISDENVISATDTTYSDFVGTDGTAAGTAGLVPAPAATDTDKFLKSDGTWALSGGGIKALSSADYNWHSTGTTDDKIALWKLPSGVYSYTLDIADKVYIDTSTYCSSYMRAGMVSLIIINQSVNGAWIIMATDISGGSFRMGVQQTQGETGTPLRAFTRIPQVFNDLDHTSQYDALSANQGTVLKGLIEKQGNTLSTSAPTTSTVGVLGQLYTDTTNMHTYQCTAVSGSTYTWTQRW